MSQLRIEVLDHDDAPIDPRAAESMGMEAEDVARLERLEAAYRDEVAREQQPEEAEVQAPERPPETAEQAELVKDQSTIDERRELAKDELADQESQAERSAGDDPKITDQRIDAAKIKIQDKASGRDTYTARVSQAVRERDLGHFSSEERPVDRDGGKGVQAAMAAYVADAERQANGHRPEAAQETEPATQPADPAAGEGAGAAESPERRAQDQGAPMADPEQTAEATAGRLGEERATDEPARADGREPAERRADADPAVGDDTQARQPEAEQPAKAAVEESRPVAPGLVVDLTEDGRRSQLFLHGMKTGRPDIFGHPDFGVVVGAPTAERAELIRRSGAFDEYIAAGKATITTIDHQQPTLPQGTRMVLAPPVNNYPAVRLYTEDGQTKVAAEATYVKGRDVVVTVDEANYAEVADPYFFRSFGTVDADAQLTRMAPKLADRVFVKFLPEELANTEVGRREITAANAVQDMQKREFVNFQPGVEEMLAALSGQAPLVYVEGRMANPTNRPPRDRLLEREGLVANNMTEIAALQRAAGRAGAALVVPPGEAGEQHYALLNSNKDETERASVAQAFDQAVSAPARPALALVRKAQQYLSSEQAGELSSGISAEQSIMDSYAAHLGDYPEAAIDYDLALALGRAFYNFGHYDQAMAMADQAIAAAPQVAAAAHTLRARALMSTDQLAEARGEIGLALDIAPHDRHIYQAIAQLSAIEGNDIEYRAALLQERQLSPCDDNWEEVRAWRAIIDAAIREAMRASDEPNQLRVQERTVQDQTTGEWIIEHEAQPVSARDLALSEARALQLAAEDAIRQLFDHGPGELQDPAVAALRNVPELEGVEPPAPEHLVYTVDEVQQLEALRARILASVEGRVASLAVSDMPNLVGHRGEVLLGYKIDGEGNRIATTDPWVSVIFDELNRHLFIAGASGSGKSTLERLLYTQLALQGMPGLLIDGGRRSQFRPLVDDLLRAGVDVAYMDPTDMARAALTLRLLSPEPGFPVQGHAENVKRILWMMTAAREPFSQIANRAVQQLYAEAGHKVRDRAGRWTPDALVADPETPLLDRFIWHLLREADLSGYDRIRGDINAMVGNRASDLNMDPLLSFIGDGDQELSIPQLVKRFSVLDLSNTEDPVNSLLGATLAIRIEEFLRLQHQQNGGRDFPLKFMFGLAEGQFILGKPHYYSEGAADQIQRAESFGASLTGWRGLGGGVQVSSHTPQKVIDEVIGNSAVKIALRTENPEDRDVMIRAMGGTQDDYDRLGRVQPGQALIRWGGSDRPEFIQVHAQPREEITIATEPRLLSDPPVRGLHREQLITRAERQAAELAVSASENADWVLWTTALTLAFETNSPIPRLLGNIQQKWDQGDLRAREVELDMHLANAVRERLPYRSEALIARLKHVALNALSGGPVVGKLPGREYVNPQLQWLLEYESRVQPYFQETPNGSGPGIPIVGLGGRPAELPMDSIASQIEALANHELASRGPGEGPKHNREMVLQAIRGTQHGRRFYQALERFYAGQDRNVLARLRALDVDLGFVNSGEPRAGILSRLMLLPGRVVRWQ